MNNTHALIKDILDMFNHINVQCTDIIKRNENSADDIQRLAMVRIQVLRYTQLCLASLVIGNLEETFPDHEGVAKELNRFVDWCLKHDIAKKVDEK